MLIRLWLSRTDSRSWRNQPHRRPNLSRLAITLVPAHKRMLLGAIQVDTIAGQSKLTPHLTSVGRLPHTHSAERSEDSSGLGLGLG